MDYTNQNNSSSYRHTHNGIDSEKLSNKAVASALGAPKAALTPSTGGSLATYNSTEVSNMRTRIDELEARLQSLGLLS